MRAHNLSGPVALTGVLAGGVDSLPGHPTVGSARAAVDLLTYALPESRRKLVRLGILASLHGAFQQEGVTAPAWLDGLMEDAVQHPNE